MKMAARNVRKNPFGHNINNKNQTNNFQEDSNNDINEDPSFTEILQQRDEWEEPNQDYTGRMTNPFGTQPEYSRKGGFPENEALSEMDANAQSSTRKAFWSNEGNKADQYTEYNQGNPNYDEKVGYGGSSQTNPMDNNLNEPPLLEGELTIFKENFFYLKCFCGLII